MYRNVYTLFLSLATSTYWTYAIADNRLRGSSVLQPHTDRAAENIETDETTFTDSFLKEESLLVNPTRYFARYNGRQGRRLVQRCASKVIEDDDHTDFTIFENGHGSDALPCLDMLKRSSAVLTVEEDHPAWAFAPLLDTSSAESIRSLGEQIPWGIQEIQADLLDQGKANVTICVVDTGVAAKHPDLHSDRITGVNMEEKNWMWDQDRAGHGTHVAGTIAAAAGNDIGVQGVGNFNLMVVRALGDSATGYESDIWKAVQICIDKKADVINLSLGTPEMSSFARDLYTKAVEEDGIIMVAAAGNSADTTKYYPASHPSVIAVGGTGTSGKRFFSSVTNDQIEFVAPGENILSTSVATHAVHTPDGFAFPANRVVGVPNHAVTGNLVECNAGSTCDDAEGGGICLFDVATSGSNLEDVVMGCKEGGGAGAVFYNGNKPMDRIDSVYVRGSDTIPVVCVSKKTGLDLVQNLEDNEDSSYKVTIGDKGDDRIEFTWETMSGTSMAAPHVSASLALLKSHFPSCSNHQLRYALASNAENPDGGCNDEYGYGMIKVKDTYDWLMAKDGCDWDIPHKSTGGCSTL
jgi:serine protease